jgi:adenosylcobinamide kinase / adenosylcobinamide-phosphate guanylyltransferase
VRRGFFVSQVIFITGGARSGKSRLAEQLAEGFGAPLAYIATGEPRDAEMRDRIERHRERRGPGWHTVEEPFNLLETVKSQDGIFKAMLVDCITLWLSNLLLEYDERKKVMEEVALFSESFPTLKTPLILVSNEVGMGIVPENQLARTFRDIAGEANNMLAKAADEVYVMFSGLPLKLKG